MSDNNKLDDLMNALDLIDYYQKNLEKLVEEHTKELEITKQMYHTLSRQSPIGVSRITDDNKLEYINRKFREMVGIDVDDNEHLERKFIKSIHSSDRKNVAEAWKFMRENDIPEHSFEFKMKHPKTNEYRSVIGHSKRVNGGGKGYVCTITCVDNKKKMISELENIKNIRIK